MDSVRKKIRLLTKGSNSNALVHGTPLLGVTTVRAEVLYAYIGNSETDFINTVSLHLKSYDCYASVQKPLLLAAFSFLISILTYNL